MTFRNARANTGGAAYGWLTARDLPSPNAKTDPTAGAR